MTSMRTDVVTLLRLRGLLLRLCRWHRRSCRRCQWLGHMLQRELKSLVYPLHRLDVEILLDVLGYVGQLALVLLRGQHGEDAGTVRGLQFFFQAADRQH